MIPLLYRKDGTTKIGELNNCIECLVEEERNGLFEVSIIYPTTDSIFNSFENENIIIVDANDTLKAQKFRIYMTRKLMANRIEVLARHISFDLAYDYIENINITNQSCEYALNTIFRSSQFSTNYRGYSDIVNAQNYSISDCNCIEAIAGKEGSIVDTFGTGAEILRDNTTIYVKNRRGNDNLVSIEYAKNLTGFELEEDTTDLITRILPYARYTPEGGEETIVKANAVDSSFINNYSHPYIASIDYSDKFEDGEVPTTSKLTTFAQNEYRDNKVDIPKQNYKIEFIPLSKCVGYEGIEDKISLCDTVTIKDTRYNVDTKAKVIRTVFDVLKNRYESMELGEPRTTLGDIIGSGDSGKGEQGPAGPTGPPGVDGNIGDFPNSLPPTPVLSSKLYGFSSIELSWTFENKVYYQYELYASKIKDFKPNTFDIIHQGQTSSFLFQAKPNETWYFRVCAVNSHGNRTAFSSQISVTTTKIDDLSNYFEEMAIGNALIGCLNADYMSAGIIKGQWIDAKMLTVTDGNGKRTLDIDSFGRVRLDVTELNINSSNVATEAYATLKRDEAYETAYDDSKNYTNAQLRINSDSIMAEVSKKTSVEDVKATMELNPNSLMIGFNGINDNIVMSQLGMFFKYWNGKKALSLRGGQMQVFNPITDKFLGAFGTVATNTFSGAGYLAGTNCQSFTIDHAPDWMDESHQNPGQTTPVLRINFVDSDNGLVKGIHLASPLYCNSFLDMKSHDLINVSQLHSDQILSNTWKTSDYPYDTLMTYANNSILLGRNLHMNSFSILANKVMFNELWTQDAGKLLLRNDGNNFYNGASWDWNGHNLYNANIVTNYSLDATNTALSNEEYATYDKENNIIEVDVNKMNESLYLKNNKLEKENEILKQNQFVQDELIIESAFEISNIQLGGLY